MGQIVSKRQHQQQQQQQEPVKECHLQISTPSTALTTDGRQVFYDRENFDYCRNTFFTQVPVCLEKDVGQQFEITVKGGAVLRIGLLDERPREDDFVKKAIFEEEDGFGCGSSSRCLYRNTIGYIQYGPPDKPREFQQLTETVPLWVYVIVIYGSPKITATFDGPVKWDAFGDTDIEFPDDPPTQAVCGLVTHSEKCIITEAIEAGDTYMLRWDMRLQEVPVADRHPRFGYMRLAMVDRKPTSLAALSLNLDMIDDSVVWCSDSAVRCYPYSGAIAVRLAFDAETQWSITHNLLVDSVETTATKQNLPVPEKSKLNLKLVVEMSCGSLTVKKGPNVPVEQFSGSIFHVKMYKEFDTERRLINDIARLGHMPCRILYGADPTSFVVEFNDYVSPAPDEKKMKAMMTHNITRLKETNAIQALQVPADWEEYEIGLFFSNESACGGGEIKSATRLDDIWIIEYTSAAVARSVYMTPEYSYEGNVFKVLPYYKELGCTVNSGQKPVYDMESLIIKLDKFDEAKVRFVRERSEEVKHLRSFLKQTANVSLEWKDAEPIEFERDEDDDEDEEAVKLSCDYSSKDFQKLVKWKEIANSALEKYFANEIKESVVRVEANRWENVRSRLNSNGVEYTEDKIDGTFKLISSDKTKLKKVSEEIGKVLPDIETKTEVLKGNKAEKFLVLDSNGKVDDLGKKYIGTRVSKDRQNKEVTFSGPKEEVEELIKDIHIRLLNVRSIAVTISSTQEQVCRRAAKQISTTLKMNIGTETFQLSKRSISVFMYFDKNTDDELNQTKLQSCINEVIQYRRISIKASAMNICSQPSWKTFVENTQSQFASCITVNNKADTIDICALKTQLEKVCKEIQQFLNLKSSSTEIVKLTHDIAEYIDDQGLQNDETFTLDKKGDEYTGKIIIQGDKSSHQATKQLILDETRDIKTFWFTMEQDWLVSIIEELSLNQISARHRCVLTIEFGDTLATSGVPAVSVLKTNGVAVLVKQGSIAEMAVDALVSAADAGLKTESKIAQAIDRTGGHEIGRECDAYVKTQGTGGVLQEGDVAMTTAGILPCCKVIHAVIPSWQDGNSNEDTLFITTIKKVLQAAEDEHLSSVAIPVLSYGTNEYPVAKACEYTVAAIRDYVEKVGQTSLATVFLCDISKKAVDDLTSALEKTLNGGTWTFFKHEKALTVPQPDMVFTQPEVPQDTPITRPGTAGRLRWKPETIYARQPQVDAVQLQTDSEGSDDEGDIRQNAAFAGGLPFNIEISNTCRLNIIKGQIDATKVDAIVCPTFHFPDLSGTIYNSVKKAAGPQFEQECQALGSLDFGEVKRVSGGNLPCQHVYLVKTETKWTDSSSRRIYDLVKQSLHGASKYGLTSLAFPTFGTGFSKYPVHKVAAAMIASVRKFALKTPNTSLKEIYIVVYYKDLNTIGVVQTCVPKIFKPLSGAEEKSPKGNQQRRSKGQRDRQAKKPLRYKKPSNSTDHSAMDDFVMFKVISKIPGGDIQRDVEQLVKEEFITREIEFEFEAKEDKLSQDETSKLMSLANENGIRIAIEENNRPKVILSGLRSKVLKAEAKFNIIIFSTFADTRLKKKMTQNILSQFQWLYEDGGKWLEVGVDCVLDIHMDYLKGKDFTYKNGPTMYQVILQDLVEHPIGKPHQKRNIRLKNKITKGIKVPDDWSISVTEKEFEEVELDPSSPEYMEVKRKFLAAKCQPSAFERIVRIEDRYKWLQYQTQKLLMEKQNPPGTQNERELWHGTDKDTARLIIQKGYDRSFVGKHANVYGRGVYFAIESAYSNGYAAVDNKGVRRMFLNKVLTGIPTTVDSDVGVLPARVDTKDEVILYDSAVNNMNNITMYVIFHDTQAYPLYLIEYKA